MIAARTIVRIFGTLTLWSLASCGSGDGGSAAWDTVDPTTVSAPQVPEELRAVWVATVANIDWPSRPGLEASMQQAEAIRILDLCRDLRLNAVILQVRPSADAIYPSALEPWSEYLSGRQGGSVGYDPLQFWIDEAHARGLDLHAWLNTFRARHRRAQSPPSPAHISQRRPDLVHPYGEEAWLDPGSLEAQQHSLRVIEDLVRRYDLDGIHVDDYFYPYPIKGEEFPDDATYAAYQREGGRLDRSDWRRSRIDSFVRSMYERVKAIDPEVLVGVSPFGIWRPGHPEGVAGLDAYEELHADSRLWIRAGWLDYFSPQLYWPIDAPKQPFLPLLEWWSSQNTRDRHLWPGLYLTRIEGDGGWSPQEIASQIETVRGHHIADGVVLFSMVGLLENRQQVAELLAGTAFPAPALVPASPWLFREPPAVPEARIRETADSLQLELTSDPRTARWLVQWRTGDGWEGAILPGSTREHAWPPGVEDSAIDLVRVQAISRVGERSEPVLLRRREPVPMRLPDTTTRP